jgi:hypothetical protein
MRFAHRSGTRVTRAAIVTVASGVLAAGAVTVVMSASASPSHAAGTPGMMGAHVTASRPAYGFRTVDNAADLTFNQLLGINNEGAIAGYFGSGAQGHPNIGYLLTPAGYQRENVPSSVQTQVTGLNDSGVTVGFSSSMNDANLVNDNHGFVEQGGQFRTADFPAGQPASPPVDQLLGVNDHDIAVGFYTDAKGNTDGFTATPATPSVTHLQLQAMPHGTATFVWAANGQLTLQLSAFGFTPGSSHLVQVQSPQGATIAQFSPLTANGAGQVQQTLYSTDMTSVPVGSHLMILLDGQSGAIASVPVAQTAAIAAGDMAYQLQSVEVGPTGTSYGTPQGQATVAYDPGARTITVTLSASGLTPGAHAAHIHIGSCASQGPVQDMLMDFTANSQGQITHEVRTVTGVSTPLPATGWYLNLHQGTSNTILANGQPTPAFRPLLCAGI